MDDGAAGYFAPACLVAFCLSIPQAGQSAAVFHSKGERAAFLEDYAEAPAFFLPVALYRLYCNGIGAAADKKR